MGTPPRKRYYGDPPKKGTPNFGESLSRAKAEPPGPSKPSGDLGTLGALNVNGDSNCWVAAEELISRSCHVGETILITMYTHYGNLI